MLFTNIFEDDSRGLFSISFHSIRPRTLVAHTNSPSHHPELRQHHTAPTFTSKTEYLINIADMARPQSSPRPQSPANTPSGSTTARPASPKPPGGPATVMRRKAAADRAEKSANQRPSSTRAAGA